MNSLLDNHRGWVADIFADGLRGHSDAPDPRATAAVDAKPLSPRDHRRRDETEVIGWRALCTCGAWQGRTWLRAEHAADHAPLDRVLHCPGGRLAPELSRLVVAEWDYHRLEMQALLPVHLAYQDSASAQQRLVEAVRFVRASGASWDAVGRVIGAESAEAAERTFRPWLTPTFADPMTADLI